MLSRRPYHVRSILVAFVGFGSLLIWHPHAAEAQDIGRVTQMIGIPRLDGRPTARFQTILSGQFLETSEDQAAALLSPGIVVHAGSTTKVTPSGDRDRFHLRLDAGYVVVYVDPGSRREVVVETPCGRLTASGGGDRSGPQGWHSVRHEIGRPGVPAMSTFAVIDGKAIAVGTVPTTTPHQIVAGQLWRIVCGQQPDEPITGDLRGEAIALSEMLHRGTAEAVWENVGTDLLPGETLALVEPQELIEPNNQLTLIDANGIIGDPPLSPFVSGNSTVVVEPIAPPQSIPAGVPQYTLDHQIERLENGGYSYIQLAGPGYGLSPAADGEQFLVRTSTASNGWAIYTPLRAFTDAVGPNSGLLEAVSLGLRDVAYVPDRLFAPENVPLAPNADLHLPADRTDVQVLFGTNIHNQGLPLADAGVGNTVGIQFAGRGEIVAIIHHAPRGDVGDDPFVGTPWEAERHPQYTIIRWADNHEFQLQDLSGSGGETPEGQVRGQLFGAISEEVQNILTPIGSNGPTGTTARGRGDAAALRTIKPSFVRPRDARTLRSPKFLGRRTTASDPLVSQGPVTPRNVTGRPSAGRAEMGSVKNTRRPFTGRTTDKR